MQHIPFRGATSLYEVAKTLEYTNQLVLAGLVEQGAKRIQELEAELEALRNSTHQAGARDSTARH